MTNPSRGELVPGGLAMVIGSLHENSKYIGSIVVLVEQIDSKFGEAWKTEPVSSGAFIALSRHLLPISPEPDPLHINHEEQQEQSA